MKVGLYCGSFNPFHKGHLNIYHKAQKLFDKVVACQGINPEKSSEVAKLFHVDGVETQQYFGLTTDLIAEYEAWGNQVTLIRGLRNGYDYDYEMNQIEVMRDLHSVRLQVILIPCDREFTHISSSMIRALQKFYTAAAQKYLP